MSKAHLIDSQEPLTEGKTLTALCQAEIPHAQFVFFFDSDTHDFMDSLNTLLLCRKCLDVVIEKRYVYGILAGQEAKDARTE